MQAVANHQRPNEFGPTGENRLNLALFETDPIDTPLIVDQQFTLLVVQVTYLVVLER